VLRASTVIVLFAPVLLAPPSVHAQDCDPQGHLDIGLVVQNGQIATGVFQLDDPNHPALIAPGTRVWGGQLGANPQDPFFTDDPGFGAVAGSGLPQGSLVGFDVLDDLQYWNGLGPVSFGPVPNGEKLRIKLGAQNRYVGTGTGFQSGFNVASAGAGGTIHVHPSLFLWGADGNAVPATQDGVEATPGIYLLTLQVRNSDPTIAPSAPLYIVLLNGVDGCAHCTALNEVGARMAHDRAPADLTFDRRVDHRDFEQFAACFTGPGIAWTDPCCQDADLDRDGDIDLTDFGLLQRCYAGPDAVADPDCAP
jgi:hypothetical protein